MSKEENGGDGDGKDKERGDAMKEEMLIAAYNLIPFASSKAKLLHCSLQVMTHVLQY